MDNVWEECRVELQASNLAWQKHLRLKALAQSKQVESAALIKKIYKKLHEEMLARFGNEGTIEMQIKDEAITGLLVTYPFGNTTNETLYTLGDEIYGSTINNSTDETP